MSKGLVSIVILTYNRIDLLIETLEHINKSSYNNFEIIIVNNASNDNTHEYLKDKNYDSINLKKNIGVEGWNKGIEKANGEYILLLDDDAYPKYNAIEKAVDEFNNTEYVCIAFNIYDKSTGKQHLTNWQPDETKFNKVDTPVFIGCAVMYKSDILKRKEFQVPDNYFVDLHELPMAYNLYLNKFRILFDRDIIAYHYFKTGMYDFIKDAWVFKNRLLFINNILPVYLSVFYNIQCVLFYFTRALRHLWITQYVDIISKTIFFNNKELRININYFMKLRRIHVFNLTLHSKFLNK